MDAGSTAAAGVVNIGEHVLH